MQSFKLKFNAGLNAMILQASCIVWMYATASVLLGHRIIKQGLDVCSANVSGTLTCMCCLCRTDWSVSCDSRLLGVFIQYVKFYTVCQFFFFLLVDDIIKLNKKEERKQYSPKIKRGLQQNRARQFSSQGSKWGIQQQKGMYAKHNMDSILPFLT